METSPSEPDEDRTVPPIAGDTVRARPEPTPEEAAAIAAALQAYLLEEAEETEDIAPATWWRDRAWRLHDRFGELRQTTGRPDSRLPRDPWRAADRARRL